jgi:hypothetical protein
MLPQVFKPQSPVFELAFAPEHQRELERLLAALPPEVFKASDSLGWVYQFWQAKRKDEVNASEVKIGADELPAVTQLFTEPYMVDFLLHNSLGAWWVTRHPGKTCPVPLTYLRTLDDGTPAAGKFEGWPDRLDEFKLLDPCCGSGHFLVAAFLLLVPMRMAAEGLSAMDAVDAVLADNLHGLELDARCVEIAVFALALAAWRFPDENGDPLGVRADMPAPQVACCGLKVAAKPEDWMALVPDDAANAAYLRQELRLLHASFAQAPLLGSLLDPARSLKNDLATSSFDTLRDLLGRALATERPATLWGQASELQDDSWDLALTAKGLLDAARLLDGRYDLVVTNVPYVGQKQMATRIARLLRGDIFCRCRADLAAVFMLRALELTVVPKDHSAVVAPQSLSFLTSYADLRLQMLHDSSPRILVKLGAKAFQSQLYDFTVGLWITSASKSDTHQSLALYDVSGAADALAKSDSLVDCEWSGVQHARIPSIPDARFTDAEIDVSNLLAAHAIAPNGMHGGDSMRFRMAFWEIGSESDCWVRFQSPTDISAHYAGRVHIFYWPDGGKLHIENAKMPVFKARALGDNSWSCGVASCVTWQ